MQPGSFLVADPAVSRRFKKSVTRSGSTVIRIMRPTGLCSTLALSWLLTAARKLQLFFFEPGKAPNGRIGEVNELTTTKRQRSESLEAESIMIYHSCWNFKKFGARRRVCGKSCSLNDGIFVLMAQ